ncbi:MAG: HIT family protein [Bacteriovoracaceae bacterium]
MCPLCERVNLTGNGQYPYLIKEFDHSYLYLGEHQFYEGYCVLVTKEHYREMSDISSPVREEIFSEMMKVSDAILKTFNPKKMNMASYGNVVEHLHWHFFPRYADDPQFTNPPWLQMHLFDSKKVSPQLRDKLISEIRKNLY